MNLALSKYTLSWNIQWWKRIFFSKVVPAKDVFPWNLTPLNSPLKIQFWIVILFSKMQLYIVITKGIVVYSKVIGSVINIGVVSNYREFIVLIKFYKDFKISKR